MNMEARNGMEPAIASGAAKSSDILKSSDRMKYALEHFKYLADQRMKTFNYYAIVVAASITGSITAFDKCPWQLLMALGVIHLVMAWIFFVIDIRNSRLVYFARKALIYFENAYDLDPLLRVIGLDQEATESACSGPLGRAHHCAWQQNHPFRRLADGLCKRVGSKGGASFTAAFNMAFVLQVTCGLGIIAAAWWLKGPGALGAH